MSNSTAIEASLRLDIAQMKAALAESRGEATKWREKLRDEGRKAAQAVDPVVKAYAAAAAKAAATAAINPWVTASAGAQAYKRVLDSMTPAMAKAHAMLAASGGRSQALFAPQTSNPWTSASAGYKAPERLPRMAFGSEFDNSRALVAQAQQQQQRQAASRALGRGGSGGGGGMRNIGQVSMQAQDIAVQLQMGTRASTVLAQQGSQLLSVFGPAGAIAGGAIAIGAAFYTMGEKAKEGLDEARKKAAGFDDELKQTLLGTSQEIVNSWKQVGVEMEESTAKLEGLTSGGSALMAHAVSLFTGPSMDEQKDAQNTLRVAQVNAQLQMEKQLVETSRQEAAIALMRASGEAEKADAMERELALAREIAKINALPLAPSTREQLTNDARTKSEASAATPRDLKGEKEEILQLDRQIYETRLRMMPPAQRLVALVKEEKETMATMATTGGAFFQQNVKGLEDWAEAKRKAGDAKGLAEVLKVLEKVHALRQQISQTKDEADQETKRADSEKASEESDKRRVELTRETLAIETRIAREQAKSGMEDSPQINAFRDELNTLQLTAQLQDQLNLKKADAVKLAKEHVQAERDAATVLKKRDDEEKAKGKYRQLKDITTEMRVDALRATGRFKAAGKVEREGRLQEQAESIQDATGFSATKSEALARKNMNDKEKAAFLEAREAWNAGGRTGPMPKRPTGVAGRDGSTVARLSDYDRGNRVGTSFQRMQNKPSAFNQLQAQPSDWDKLQKRPSDWDMLQANNAPAPAPLAAQHAQNAAANSPNGGSGGNAAGTHQARVEQLLREMSDYLRDLAE